ncbi:biogenesis of lysosome-related organelles complex 1 subunit 5-like [Asterias amurensis]|uniref:biogenesis of lysosome-related organelles complex 1 subunit 5-like n=1 Tax=Asterias amurensis TaxID=7602 RepID=UPI003AB42045
MMVENVIKDLGEIHARLLDHKPVVQGEIRFFIKEFENKRNDREQKRLERIEHQLGELNEKTFPSCISLMEKHLTEAKEQLDVSNLMCKKLQTQEEERLESKPLESLRVNRDKEWTSFLEKLNQERDVLDSQHQQRIQDLEDHFEKLKQNLNLQT